MKTLGRFSNYFKGQTFFCEFVCFPVCQAILENLKNLHPWEQFFFFLGRFVWTWEAKYFLLSTSPASVPTPLKSSQFRWVITENLSTKTAGNTYMLWRLLEWYWAVSKS